MRRNHVHILLIIDDPLRHEAVAALNASLRKIACEAKVLAARTKCSAGLLKAWSPHHRDNNISRPDAINGASYAHHLAHRFVSDHEIR